MKVKQTLKNGIVKEYIYNYEDYDYKAYVNNYRERH
jgi:hypothetical protein